MGQKGGEPEMNRQRDEEFRSRVRSAISDLMIVVQNIDVSQDYITYRQYQIILTALRKFENINMQLKEGK